MSVTIMENAASEIKRVISEQQMSDETALRVGEAYQGADQTGVAGASVGHRP